MFCFACCCIYYVGKEQKRDCKMKYRVICAVLNELIRDNFDLITWKRLIFFSLY